MPAPIDIDRLSEADLIDLNHRIVARLNWLREARAHAAMLDFRIGEEVEFFVRNRAAPVAGTLVKYNRKSVTVITPAGEQWTVSPTLLRRPAVTVQAEVHRPDTLVPRDGPPAGGDELPASGVRLLPLTRR